MRGFILGDVAGCLKVYVKMLHQFLRVILMLLQFSALLGIAVISKCLLQRATRSLIINM